MTVTSIISTWPDDERLRSWVASGLLVTEAAQPRAGEELRAVVSERAARSPLTAVEHRDLESWRDGISAGHRRRSLLVSSAGRRAAEVSAVYAPGRIEDPDVLSALQCTAEPLGRALGPLGTRCRLLACDLRPTGPIAVVTSVCLLLGDLPVALAREHVYRF
jgi:hypothetical protein